MKLAFHVMSLLYLCFIFSIATSLKLNLQHSVFTAQRSFTPKLATFFSSPGVLYTKPVSKTCTNCAEKHQTIPLHHSSSWNRRLVHVPNALTIGRICSIPVFAGSFLSGKPVVAFTVFVVSALTDMLDGFIARRFRLSSEFGSFLDPVADKLMVAMALVLLTTRFPSPLYTLPVALILCRELFISALREWMASKGVRNIVEVGALGKIKTLFQMTATVLLLAVVPDKIQLIDMCMRLGVSKVSVFTSGMVMLYVSLLLTIYSGGQYLSAAWPVLTRKTK